MLTKSKAFEGALPGATMESAHRLVEDNGQHRIEETRFKLVVDELDEPIGAVTDRYTLVQNRDLVSALDIAAEAAGLRLEAQSGEYHKGRSAYELIAPDLEFQIPGDESKVAGRIVLGNDYRGSGGIKIDTGFWRWRCSNGLIVGEVLHSANKRHVGEIDLMGIIQPAVNQLVARFEADKLVAESLGNTPTSALRATLQWSRDREGAQNTVRHARQMDRRPELMELILADTADRYHGYMRENADRLSRQAGDTLWGLAQLVAETATHRMNGRFAPEDWGRRQFNRIVEYAG